jgi:hypothetical protein
MSTKISRRLLPSLKWNVSKMGLNSVGEIASARTAIVSTQLTIRLKRLIRLRSYRRMESRKNAKAARPPITRSAGIGGYAPGRQLSRGRM